jgi:hypothetical protein
MSRIPRQVFREADPRPSWKLVLPIAVIVAVVFVGSFGRRLFDARKPDPGVDEAGVVTVVSVIGGYQGKFVRRFDHRVRFDSGSEATMTFREIFPKGARIWVSYRRYPGVDRFEVTLYKRSGS